MIFPEMSQRSLSGNRLHPPHTRRNTAFLQNLDQSDLTGRSSVRAAAKLSREVADLDHAHLVPILLPEQSHRVILIHRDIDRNIGNGLYLPVAQHLFVDDVLDVLELFIRYGGEVREIKS